MTHAEEGAAVLSELHDREQRAFELNVENGKAAATSTMAEAGVNFAKADVFKSLAGLIAVVTILLLVSGITLLIERWSG